MKHVLDAELRANPEYQLVELSMLSAEEKRAFGSLGEDADCFGILRPVPGSSHTIKLVYSDTALLLSSLRQPGRIPAYLRHEIDRNGDKVARHVIQLVLDGVLEIESDGGFISGASAQSLLQEPVQNTGNQGRIATLSIDALKFAQRLPIDEPLQLSAQLYFYHRDPITPEWKRRVHDFESHGKFLGFEVGGTSSPLLHHWTESPANIPSAGWRSWHGRQRRNSGSRSKVTFKLYVSPRFQSLPDVLPGILEAFVAGGVQQFKIGADLSGLTRPDKLVAYFDTFDDVERVGRLVMEAIPHADVHGVPFTADLLGDGLLSWGMDPHDAPLFDGYETESWRLWITNHLARSLILARRSSALDMEPWQFALNRLRLEGIDTDTWTPLTWFEGRP